MIPTVEEERALAAAGFRSIAGIDEAGRGCWAGPVVAAATILPANMYSEPNLLAGVNDSKALSATERERLFVNITALASGWAVGIVPAHLIDTHGILPATKLAMQLALLSLPALPDALLIDAVKLPNWPCPSKSLIKGDARCLSIAAASIIAKVTRDRLMRAHDRFWPVYGFGRHKGYGTAAHLHALREHGPISLHRHSFRPISTWAATGRWDTPIDEQEAYHDE